MSSLWGIVSFSSECELAAGEAVNLDSTRDGSGLITSNNSNNIIII